MMKSKVYVSFPKVGLGNMLLIWARAFVFANKNGLEICVSQWWGIRLRAWFTNASKKRLYLNYFIEDSFLKKLRFKFYKIFSPTVDVEQNLPEVSERKKIYLFQKMNTQGDFFKDLKGSRNEIKEAVFKMLHPDLMKKISKYEHPTIGIHIRRGDFLKGSTITSLDYFIQIILKLREVACRDLPVTVFSDATDYELEELFCMDKVERAEAKEDILDIMLLSKSKFLILSIGSTFSFWAAFLSDGAIIKNPVEWHPDIRPAEINKHVFEGKIGINDPLPQIIKEELQEMKQEKYLV